MSEKGSTTETGAREAGPACPAGESERRSPEDRAGRYQRFPPRIDVAAIVVAVLFILLLIIAFTRIR